MNKITAYAPGLVGAALLVSLAACGTSDLDITKRGELDTADGRPATRLDEPEKLLAGGNLFSLGTGDDEQSGGGGADLPVNRFLWRATLDTLAFLPLSSTDPYGGVIVTDWGSTPEAPEERFKVTAYITSAVLKPQSLRVVVNRQTRSEAGQWVAGAVSPDTGRQIENAILTRARILKTGEKPDE